jgi:hypothetical protein
MISFSRFRQRSVSYSCLPITSHTSGKQAFVPARSQNTVTTQGFYVGGAMFDNSQWLLAAPLIA